MIETPEVRVAPIDFSQGFPEHQRTIRSLVKNEIAQELCSMFGHQIAERAWDVSGDTRAVVQVSYSMGDYIYSDIVKHGERGFALGYVQGAWSPDKRYTEVPKDAETGHSESDALVQVMRGLGARTARVRGLADRFANIRERVFGIKPKDFDDDDGAQQYDHEKIQTHYDIGNALYTGESGFLDDTHQQYSAGILTSGGTSGVTLEEMQENKVQELIRKLDLSDGQRVLEIGTGWGGLGQAILQAADVELVSLTLSSEQAQYAEQRFKEAGVDDRADVRIEHYRSFAADEANLGAFDRLVSVEMIEAVEWQYLNDFLGACADVTSNAGRIVLQAIMIPDNGYSRHKTSKGFVVNDVFPGNRLHSRQAITEGLEDLGWRKYEETDLTESYVHTLRAWRQRFNENYEGLSGLWQEHGVSPSQCEQFQRGWNMYLATCEAYFWDRHTLDSQFTFVPAAR